MYDLVRAAGGKPVGRALLHNSTVTPNCDTCAARLAAKEVH